MKTLYCILFSMILMTSCTSTQQTTVPTVASSTAVQNTAVAQPASPTRSPDFTASPIPSIPPQASETQAPEPTASLTATVPPTATPSPQPTLAPDRWKKLPVVPTISDTVVQIYRQGLQSGNNARAFSKVGDCGSTPAWFLGDFDRGPLFYRLGSYEQLTGVIQEFQGSFGRTSLAARSGFNAAALFVTLWADHTYCHTNETPLACEYRIHKPVIAFIMLGTNDVWHPAEFEPDMRKIIEYSIDNGIVPILSTKADNTEGDFRINATIAQLAQEYDIPLWNFWLAMQSLPDQGLQEDKAHLTWARNFFDDPEAMTKAWPIRNLTALQILDAVWRKVTADNNISK
jgi:hypothetical protein